MEANPYDKIAHPAQVGGIETAILDDGPARGSRVAWVNTGSGLRFRVLPDRGFDLADAFFNQHSLAWLSPTGIVPPQPLAEAGLQWLGSFGGGLLTTCGLQHTGGPETDPHGERGLHGRISNCVGRLEAMLQPDPARGLLDFSLTGVVEETRLFGPSLRLRRTISGRIGEAAFQLHDEVTNLGNTPAPHMVLYHFNFGWPLADEGTRLLWQGKLKPRFADSETFRPGHDYQTCPPPLNRHRGTGEDVALIDAIPDTDGLCVCGLYNPSLSLAVALQFRKAQLPVLTNWQHFGPGEYVTGLEPGTHGPVGQAAARADGSLIFLQPGESRHYDLRFEVLTHPSDVQEFMALFDRQ